ncbi:MAG: hypothetical protein JXR97_03760, partial [Planctomycetes bacterium]|nr:hypothetical protein [Planctomycetota bacterium]
DLMIRMQMYPKGIDWYGFALKVLDSIRPEKDDGSYKRFYTTEQKIIRDRIVRSLAEAKRLLEIEQYGKGWVLYRYAEQTRRKEHDYLKAYLQYESIKTEFPKTVYSEASTCYGINCLLALADQENVRKAKESIGKLEERLRDERKRVALLKRSDVPKATVKEMEDGLERQTKHIARMKEVPLGNDAVKAAEKTTKAFIEENRFGLYRGEVLLALAQFLMECRFDPDATQDVLGNAESWFEKVEAIDQELAAFQVPDKAANVSAVPKSSFGADRFGNLNRQDIEPGMINNRLSCEWYLTEQKRRLYQSLGFIAFFNAEKEDATRYFKKMEELDALGKSYRKRGDWDDAKRLLWGVEHGFLYARDIELKRFERKRRFGLLLADYFYVTMRFSKALELYQALKQGIAGAPSEPESAYLSYACGAACHQLHRCKEASSHFQSAAKQGKGLTRERALFAYTKIVIDPANQKIFERKVRDEAQVALEKLRVNAKTDEFRCKAILLLAKLKFESGDRVNALNLLKEVPSDSEYIKLAMAYKQIFEEE